MHIKSVKDTCTILSSIFVKNNARASGGAILFDSVDHIIIDSESKIQENKALIGGGIRILGD